MSTYDTRLVDVLQILGVQEKNLSSGCTCGLRGHCINAELPKGGLCGAYSLDGLICLNALARPLHCLPDDVVFFIAV